MPFQHTAARRRLLAARKLVVGMVQFQHTAARRRLLLGYRNVRPRYSVSTHSRPKAAAFFKPVQPCRGRSFNTQPPEGGCGRLKLPLAFVLVSTHSRPKAAAASRQTPANTGFEACDSPTLPQKAVGASIARPCAWVRPVNFLIVKELFVIAKPPAFL